MGYRRWHRTLWATVLLTLLLGGLPGSAAAAEEPDALTRKVTTPRYILDEQGIRVPGYEMNDAPGAPRLPVYGMVIELPPAGAWTLDVQTAGSYALPQRPTIPAVPVPDVSPPGPQSWTQQPDLPDSAPTIDRPDPAIYGRDALYPNSPAVAGDVQWQRGRRLLAVRVFPFQYNPVTREVRYHPEVEITIRVSAIGGGGQGSGVRRQASGDAGQAAGDRMPASQAAALGAVRVRTGERGLYRLTYDELLAADVPLTGANAVDPRSFFMTNRGQPVQIQVTGEENGAFDPGDRVIFYAEPYQGRYMTQNVYRLFWQQGPASPLTRMSTRTVTPNGVEPVVAAITQTTHIEFDRAYYSDYALANDADHWFDNPIYPTGSSPVVTRTYTLALDDPLTTGNVGFRAQLYGGQSRSATPDQSLALWLNTSHVTAWQWDGRVGYVGTASTPAAGLNGAAGATNQAKLVAALSQLPDLDEYWVYPDWIEVAYPARPDAELDRMVIEGIDIPGPTAQITVTGFTTNTVLVYDVRRPGQPVQLLATEAINNGASYALHFWDAWAADDPAASYALATPNALRAPAAVEPDALSAWRTATVEADYIAIVHGSLATAIQPLLARRAQQGLRVAKVDVQDIYDEFSDGLLDPEAIRAFLTYAYRNWNPGGERPRYVLLVGDGHYDFKFVSNTKQPDGTLLPILIPPYLVDVDPWIGETAADNRYVSVDGPGDYLPEMAIGRIPANKPADVTAVVDKVLSYEDKTQLPDGDWQSRVIFVADRCTDDSGNFHALSNETRLNALPDTYDDRILYYGSTIPESDLYCPESTSNTDTVGDMTAGIKAAFDNDAILLQWFGHASRFRWKDTVFSTVLVPTLNANNQWPFTISYSCWSGYFTNLYLNPTYNNNPQALGEAFLITPQRGAIADLSPSGLHIGAALVTLNKGLNLAIFRDRILPVGDAVNAAKQYYFANSSAWRDVLDTEILFGDPALALRLPPGPLGPPTPPPLSIKEAEEGSASVALLWAHTDQTATAYQVWRSETPYFDPNAGEGTKIEDYSSSGGVWGVPTDFRYVDDGVCGYFTAPEGAPGCRYAQDPTATVVGDVNHNYFWVVRAGNSSGGFTFANRVGEFDFSLLPAEEDAG